MKKLLTHFKDGQKKQHLLLESAIVVDIGVHVVKGSYALEGDEALALTCFDRISTIVLPFSNRCLVETSQA